MPTKLSDTALILLGKAAERDDRLAVAPPNLLAAARNAVATSLKRQGLLEVVPPAMSRTLGARTRTAIPPACASPMPDSAP